MATFETIILAALLHDIGKYIQKGDIKGVSNVGKHPEISWNFIKAHSDFFSKYVEIEELKELVLKHHENERNFSPQQLVENASEHIKPYAKLVSLADNLSSSERSNYSDNKENISFRVKPLVSIFSQIDIGQGETKESYYRAEPLKVENAFPGMDKELNTGKVASLLKTFGEEFNKLKSATISFDDMYYGIVNILGKYCWCIPSNTMEDSPDISLFNHLWTTSAIAAALFRYQEKNESFSVSDIQKKEEKFKLILCDFSGIQNYIFSISSAGIGGVAKRLRARSFFVNILLEVISHKICDAFNIPYTNTILSAGGKFYILAPNTTNSDRILEEMEKNIEEYLINNYTGEIAINMAWLNVGVEEFTSFSEVLNKANVLLNSEKKCRNFSTYLISEQHWSTQKFAFRKVQQYPCKVCGQVYTKSENETCANCDNDEKLGQRLAKAQYILFYNSFVEDAFHIYGDHYVKLLDKEDIIEFKKAYYIQNLTENSLFGFPSEDRLMVNYVPLMKDGDCEECSYKECNNKYNSNVGSTKYFDCISGASKGRRYLGYLKADVDNLGKIFVEGLKRQKGNQIIKSGTISRVSTLSRMLNIFFSGYIQNILKDEYTNCYTVFSGGDDLFLIGPWNEMLKLANRINSDFIKYTGGNPNITLSAGISVVRTRLPLSKVAEIVELQLEESKSIVNMITCKPKNQVSVFGTLMDWNTYNRILEETYQIPLKFKEAEISSNLLNKLDKFGEMYKAYQKTKESSLLRFIPMLLYEIGKSYSSPDKINIKEWLKKFTDISKNDLLYMKFIRTYIMYSKQKEA